MKIKKRITGLVTGLALAFSMAASLPAGIASAEPYDDYTYSVLTDGTVKITKYSGDETELEIPNEIDGMSVTSIGDEAFFCCSSLKSVTITDGTNTKTITGTSCFAAVMASGSTITADDGYVFIGVIVTGIPEEATLTCSMSLETAV